MNEPFYSGYGSPSYWQQCLQGLISRNEWLERRQTEMEQQHRVAVEQCRAELERRQVQLEGCIAAMEGRLRELEEANRLLKEQVDGAKPVQYGNITYKVQELHVNELTGTLNIGLTSLADEGQLKTMMEQMKMEGQDLHIPGGPVRHEQAADGGGSG